MKSYQINHDVPGDLFQIYQKADLLAVDTELHGLKLGRDHICLVQLCDAQSNVCLIRPKPDVPLTRLKQLLESQDTLKLFHFALTDVAFFKTSLGIDVQPFCCTKVMSKVIRTYTDSHGLRHLVEEFIGEHLEKQSQQTDWSSEHLSQKQLQYAANDVLHLVQVYQALCKMMKNRPNLPSGRSFQELSDKAQAVLPTLIELLIDGYGDLDKGWQTSVFHH